jgi:NAD-dependent SIR2 family protein deacetylase
METAHKTDEEKKEFFDSEEELDFKIKVLAMWIKESKHFTAFTGAGISTAAGISDYRSGINTVLKVGPGVWEKKKQKIKTNEKQADLKAKMQTAFPTLTHMALVELMNKNYLKFLISQNVDGLHIKSGIPTDKISEIHGNTNLEYCTNTKCNKKIFRDYKCRNNPEVHKHTTGRKCFDCKCELRDSIINFKENLNELELDLAFDNARNSDLMLCLGSSLRVSPASDLPVETMKNKGKIVIVNLQKTPYSDLAALSIYGKIEDVMERLMNKLEINSPKWNFSRIIEIKYNPGEKELLFVPKNSNGYYFSFIKKIALNYMNNNMEIKKEPLSYKFKDYVINSNKIELNFYFEGHYSEPIFNLKEEISKIINKTLIITYDPYEKKWIDNILC